jgi:D-arabinose 1-dehydrogenase-like Zn-dependent alcohol dehydrogenase
MEAGRIHAWGGGLVREAVPEPVPGEGEVLVEVLACGVGLTVLNCMGGQLGADPRNLPRIPGHEFVGRILDAGPGVDRRRRGELVAAYFYLFCGRCRRCLGGDEDLCEHLAGFLGVSRDGGYAPLAVLPERNAVPIPPQLDPVLATVLPDAVATPVHVARLARLAPGERVAVIGAGGGVGIHMVQVAAAYGAEVAGLESVPDKLDYLQAELGVVPVRSSDFVTARLPQGWGGRADVVVDLVGSRESLGWGLASLAGGGRLVVLTTFPEVGVLVSPRSMVFSQTSVLGSRYTTRAELVLAGRLVAEGRVRPVVGRCEDLAGVEGIHQDLRAGGLLGRGALVWSEGWPADRSRR